jgi:cell division protein ZapA (FtsZ GTPase activity inhibitor)
MNIESNSFKVPVFLEGNKINITLNREDEKSSETIQIGGRSYSFSCPEGQREKIKTLFDEVLKSSTNIEEFKTLENYIQKLNLIH